MKRTVIISGIVVGLAVIILIVVNVIKSKDDFNNLYAEAKQGAFDIVVTTTGELQAKNSTDISGPAFTQSRNIRAMDIKITDLVPEGTEVKKGDYVATLDRTTFDNNLKDEIERLTTLESNLEMKILDTAVTLSNLRDNIKNLRFTVEESQITLQQSKYEPPTTIRQAEINLDKALRSLDQAIRGYDLRVEQAKSDMRTIHSNLAEQRQRVNDLETILEKFVITAPSDGMIIYKRERTNTKRKVGSSISMWDNVVATLPDMSSMISKTYVNEIDVSKVKPGQHVELVVDAFPEKLYTGQVTSVANIGEQLPSTDAKVFEVVVEMNESDPILRPSMTTGNKIITKTIENVTYIPLESVQTGADSIPFVYLKNGKKQIVVLGESNENNVVIEQGIDPGTYLYLNTPENPENFDLIGQDLIDVIKERERLKKEEEQRTREEAKRTMMMGNDMNMSRPGMGSTNMGGPSMGAGREGGMNMTPEMRQQFANMRNSGDTAAMRQMMRNAPQGGAQGAPGNMTPEMRQRLTEMRNSGDTAGMRQMMRGMQQQGQFRGRPDGQTQQAAAQPQTGSNFNN